MLFEFLPKEYKNRARKLYRIRLVTMFTAGTLFIFLSGILLLIPSYVFVTIERRAINAERDAISPGVSGDEAETIKEFIALSDSKTKLAKENLLKQTFTEILLFISGARNEGVILTGISFARDLKGNRIQVSGTATGREALLKFTGSLENIDIFKSVDLPVSNLAKNKDIDFSIDIIQLPQSI